MLANLHLSESTQANGLPAKAPISRSLTVDVTTAADEQFMPLSLLHESLWQRLSKGFEFSDIDNNRVEEQILFLQEGLRSLHSNLIDATPYLFHITQELQRADIPLDIALLPLIESAFNPTARSSESAVGIWQFIPVSYTHLTLPTNREV